MSITKEHIESDLSYSSRVIDESDKKPTRNSPGHYDERYIELYCNDPKAGKTAALIGAGYVGEYASQEAARIHKRLADKIKQRLTEMINELDALSYNNLKTILEKPPEEVGYSNALAAIRQGMDYAGRKPGDVLTIKKAESMSDLDRMLEENQREIEQLTGTQH